jgi:hypothetical protein
MSSPGQSRLIRLQGSVSTWPGGLETRASLTNHRDLFINTRQTIAITAQKLLQGGLCQTMR